MAGFIRAPRVRFAAAVVLIAIVCSSRAAAQTASELVAGLEAGLTSAESGLREGELQIAESRYRSALARAWMLIGSLRAAEGRLPEARDAFARAGTSAAEQKDAQQSLAVVTLQMGDAVAASGILRRLAAGAPKDMQVRRLLARALIAAREVPQAVQELEEAHGSAPGDQESTYALAAAYLRVKKTAAAEALFEDIARARPIAATYVLIGRTYRDFGEYGRALAALRTALRMDPRIRHAHYYLGMVLLMDEGTSRLDDAIAEFQRELRIAPSDAAATLRLGMALVEAKRYAEALPLLTRSAGDRTAPVDALYYLGRCQIALGRAADGVASLRAALDRSTGSEAAESRTGKIHYQLGVALRSLGSIEESASHFAEAEKLSVTRVDASRERLALYLADAAEGDPSLPAVPLPLATPIESMTPAERRRLEDSARAVLARSYLNLGVMQAQEGRFPRAAEHFEHAAEAAPDFPQVQYSLGVAYFNTKQYDKAVPALERAIAAEPGAPDAQRMLAMSWLNTGAYDKAAALLEADPGREADPSLDYAYALALVKSNRAADAERAFARLLAAHGNTPELNVVIGQAHAEQGDFDGAVASLKRALELDSRVAEAGSTLGIIYLKQGRLTEAEAALRSELKNRPGDAAARQTLATVLDLQTRPDEAVAELRTVLAAKPEFADARYLLGKILLAQGKPQEAAEHLEAGTRLAPEDANIHYQLAQAYQKLGRAELAERELQRYRQIKEKRRTP